MKKIIGILLLFAVIILITMLKIAFPSKADGVNPNDYKNLRIGDNKATEIKEREYVLDYEAFNITLLDSTWVDIQISSSARRYGWEGSFIQPDSNDYLEIQLEPQKIIKKLPDDDWKDLGTLNRFKIRGRGIMEFIPNHPLY